MKFKHLLFGCLAAVSLQGMAQTHAEGVEYYEADQLQNAKELLERNLNNAGTDKAVSYYYQGLIAVREGNATAAKALFDKGVAANPEYAYNYVGLGRLLLMNGDVKGAEAEFKKADGLSKKDAALEIAIARAYDAVNPELYAKEIDKRVEKARKISLKDPNSYIFEGDRLALAKEWGNAGAKYEMAINYDPDASAAYVKYANLFTQVNPQYAINMLKKLLAVNPQSALGQRSLANAYYNNNQYAEAAQEYGKYVNNPNHFKQDEDRYAFLLFYGGDYKKGYDYATSLLQKDPGNFSAQRYQYMNAAQIKEMESQLLPMAEALWAAKKANPANNFAPIDYTLIAQEYQGAKRPQDAAEVLNAAIKDMPDNANFYKQLALVDVDLDDMPAAANTYAEYLKVLGNPGYNDYIQAAVFAYYAGVQLKSDNPAEADKYFAMTAEYAGKAGEILPDNYRPVKILGDIAMQKAAKEDVSKAAQPKYLEAVALLEASADPSRYTSDAKVMYNYLGNYYLDMKNKDEAKKWFNKYLQLDPNNTDYRKFVESL